jgi:glycosyltransferase involved in cell wall biosynthesis
MKNILLANSLEEAPQILFDVFFELEKKERFFYLLSSRPDFFNRFQANWGRAKKAYFGPEPANFFYVFLFILILPLLCVFYFFALLPWKYKKGIKEAVCLGWNEKIIFSCLAPIFRIKVIWLELPDNDYRQKPALFLFFYRLCARRAEMVVFSSLAEVVLKNLKFSPKKIIKIFPGLKLNQAGRQETIFSSLAKAEQSNFSRKYFTLGTITDFLPPNQIENLFQAIKICLAVIPNLQLIVVGEVAGLASRAGQEKKLLWLAKKIGISNLVWFVRDQENLKKWLEAFDILVVAGESPKMANLNGVLKAMQAGLPVVGFSDRGLEDIILEKKTGMLVGANNSEVLAQAIIELYNNKRLRSHLGENAREAVEKKFNLEEMAVQIENIF